ncbi:uncharacterized protein KGF55_001412 [Candida pseudojiufengensis]|uniref:uncharacterized protein n=1 Tax=Candida pseudojiufengensis TaxID=497109 RepID=UPI002224E42E|nr:uncharacterized protein KGF55_001412 [Candida pseudojiufengensis]KAI5965192.1 hypothetical protein KGF55_001412 [Candida pseudojiufengensis]
MPVTEIIQNDNNHQLQAITSNQNDILHFNNNINNDLKDHDDLMEGIEENESIIEQQNQQFQKLQQLQQLQQQQQIEQNKDRDDIPDDEFSQDQFNFNQQFSNKNKKDNDNEDDGYLIDSNTPSYKLDSGKDNVTDNENSHIFSNNHEIPLKRLNTSSDLNNSSKHHHNNTIQSNDNNEHIHHENHNNNHHNQLSPSHSPKHSIHTHSKNSKSFKIKPNYDLDYFNSFKHLSQQKRSNQFYLNSKSNKNIPISSSIPSFNNKFLQPNAQFIGEQQSGKSKFRIKVEFKSIDLKNSLITGFLQINGLTKDHQEITTYFKGEIINNPLLNKLSSSSSSSRVNNFKNYSFISENKNWGSYPQNDFEHWKKLTNSMNLNNEEFLKKLNKIQLGLEGSKNIYMRWKEEFLLPDSRIKQIPNASFEGFYYIVLNIGDEDWNLDEEDGNDFNVGKDEQLNEKFMKSIKKGDINGLYYHNSSEKFQSLSLNYVENHGVSNIFDFN